MAYIGTSRKERGHSGEPRPPAPEPQGQLVPSDLLGSLNPLCFNKAFCSG
jgi:hypothetical protein